ncbi:MAG TPA: LacI family DNA-binding transcriptional regulator [Ideonella sp.]|uniref:LacI family DNA-binding transcriptional regulator n=1 Tax=Ideonella sp. TaxID=1929293 RepID=UPI002E36DC99|nr:LacI family DNA-binding transcriptional regulator [Ideonella sp.]HEX5688222.1 LacI family DNA-binding transcriptional regulator [Ideonella sp.]
MSTSSKTAPRRNTRASTAGDGRSGAVTLQQVADRAGVSPSTVSRILNGTAVVSDDKKKAVDDAIKELGFVPNPVARGLAGGRTLSVGVVTQAIDSPFYGGAHRGIEDTLVTAGYSPLFISGHWDTAAEVRCIEVLRSRRVDGLIVLTGRMSDSALKNLARQLPIVVTGRDLSAPGVYSLNFDDLHGARLATEHLLELGHKRIAFIGGDPLHPDSAKRERGYRQALAAHGVKVDEALLLAGNYQEEGGLQAIERLLASGVPFTAIFAANDQMAFGAALALHRRGLRVPHDVSLVGFDDVATSSFTVPPLSSVHQPVYELGRLAATAMLDLLAGRRPDATLPAPHMVVRESTTAA